MTARPRRETPKKSESQFHLTPEKILLIAAAAVIAVIAFLCYLLLGNVRPALTKEAGEELVADDFLVMDWGMTAEFDGTISKVDMSKTGDYIVKVHYHGSDFYSTLHVVDTVPPEVTVQDVTVYNENLPDPAAFIANVNDGSHITVTYVQTPDMSVTGLQKVNICVTDLGGNTIFVTANMTVTPDHTGPSILGVNPMSIYQGSTISYRSGVLVEDDCDAAPVLSIDSSRVDMSQPGTYDVIYRATDAAGNLTTLTTTLTVEEKPDTYVEESVICAEADRILATFITDDMTDTQKVEAIFDYIADHYHYKDHSDKSDRLQSAYAIMTSGYGDCFNFYAVSSLFFERLGLPQVAVTRSADSGRSTRHYWNMVSVDGGQTYYHFDACPQIVCDMEICLSTDADLEKFNEEAPGYYAMDKGKYPATP